MARYCAPPARVAVLLTSIVGCTAHAAHAGPITFLTALPVPQSQAVVRGQYVFIRASDDPTWDGLGGVALTLQTKQWELDADAGYKKNTEADGFRFGDEW